MFFHFWLGLIPWLKFPTLLASIDQIWKMYAIILLLLPVIKYLTEPGRLIAFMIRQQQAGITVITYVGENLVNDFTHFAKTKKAQLSSPNQSKSTKMTTQRIITAFWRISATKKYTFDKQEAFNNKGMTILLSLL